MNNPETPKTSDPHFQRLIRCLDQEAEAETRAVLRRSRLATGTTAVRSGDSLLGLTIRGEETGFGGRVIVTLAKRDQRLVLPWTRLNPGTPVVLSEERAQGDDAWRGVVTNRDRETIIVALEESPESKADRPTYRLDLSSDEIARQRQREALRRAEAADRGRLAQLKRSLLGTVAPTFQPPSDLRFGSGLDDSQREAIRHALAADDVAVIHGPPGTGKTTAVVELIRQAIRRGERVLACAPSNLAVDNILERLLAAGERPIRIGHPARVLPELREQTLDVQVESHPDLKLAAEWTKEAWSLRRQANKVTRAAPAPGVRRDLRAEAKRLLADARLMELRLVKHLLESSPVVCATLTGLNPDLLGDLEFDLVVIDEAAQTTEPPCWIPLLRSRRLVLAGDHCQLPAVIVSNEARRDGFHISLMERLIGLYGDSIVRRLTTQYRMHQQIMQFSSDEFYESSLVAAESVRTHLLCDWPHVVVSRLTQTAVRFYDTAGSGCDERAESEGSSRENLGEATLVARQVLDLKSSGVAPREIGVITPYAAQARLLRELISDLAIEIDTVDGFQGREKEVIVISFVRSNTTAELGFLTDTRRTNVALTRARRKLIVFGDSSTLANHEFYCRLLDYWERLDVYGTVFELSDS